MHERDMAGATLPPSLITDIHRDIASGKMRDIQIAIHEPKGAGLESPSGTFNCPHCNFAASSRAEMTHHRWEVHPLLTRRKQHLMTSPKAARKRPNSESSDEGKYAYSDDIVPKKKLSPAHMVMTSCDYDADCNHVRRTSSADEILKMKQTEDQVKLKSQSLNDLQFSQRCTTSHTRQRSEGKWEDDNDVIVRCDAMAPSRDESNRSPQLTPSRIDAEGTGYLHTLARAALTAPPLVWKREEAENAISQNWWTYYGGMLHNGVALVPGAIPPVLGQFVPEAAPLHSYHQNLFVTQPSFTSPGSFPPGPSSNFPVFLPTMNQGSKLSTLSDVASRYLARVDEQGKQLAESEVESAMKEDKTTLQPTKKNSLDNPAPLLARETLRSPTNEAHSRPSGFKKSSPILTPQQHFQESKPVMDDSRVRSLEEALAKIDCCDPHERSNVIPCQCADGKWRMVKSKCVGGAWVVHVPGAVQPSVYLPLQRDAPQGTLDNWLKEQLASGPKSRPRSTSTPQPSRPVVSHPQQRHYAPSPTYNTLAASRRIPQSPCPKPMSIMSGDAIKSLLLKKTAT